jgi:hypothetical protein
MQSLPLQWYNGTMVPWATDVTTITVSDVTKINFVAMDWQLGTLSIWYHGSQNKKYKRV